MKLTIHWHRSSEGKKFPVRSFVNEGKRVFHRTDYKLIPQLNDVLEMLISCSVSEIAFAGFEAQVKSSFVQSF